MVTATPPGDSSSGSPYFVDSWSRDGVWNRICNMFRKSTERSFVSISSKHVGNGNPTAKLLIERVNLENGDKSLDPNVVNRVVLGVSKFRRLDVIKSLQLGKKVDWSNESLGNLPEVKAQNSKVLKVIQSARFRIQQIYFDTQSTVVEELDGSCGANQLFNLEKDLVGFLKNKSDLSTAEVEGIERALQKVRQSQNRALLILAIMLPGGGQVKGGGENILTCIRKRFVRNKPIEELVRELKEFTSSMLLDLKDGESLIIPFEYLLDLDGEISAHAILFEVVKKKGKFELKIFNTGAGAGFHERRFGDFYPVSLKDISSETLISLFNEDLIDVTCFSSILSTTEGIYTLIRQRIVENGGKASFLEGKPYAPQKIGSCTEECLKVWLEAELDTESGVCQKFREYKLESEIKDCRQIESFFGDKTVSYPFSSNGVDQLTAMISDGEKQLKEQSKIDYFYAEDIPEFLDIGYGGELLEAVANSDAEEVKKLLKHSFLTLPICVRNNAFLEAAKAGHLGVLEIFLEGSGYWTVNWETLDEAAKLAAEEGNLEVVRFLVKRYFQKGSSRSRMFGFAAAHSQLIIMKFLNEDKKMSVIDQDLGLVLAAFCGETIALKYLISLGIFTGNDIGRALDFSGEDVSLPVLLTLLPFVPFKYSGSVLKNLVKSEQEKKISLLLHIVAELPKEFKDEAFLEAAKNNNHKNMNILLSKDLFLEDCSQLRKTLQEAIINGHMDVIRVILDLFELKDLENLDLLEELKLAVEGNHVDIVSLLLESGRIEKGFVEAECRSLEEGSDLRGALESFLSSII